MKSTQKYLTRYAEPEAALAQALLAKTPSPRNWQYCLVVPAYKESPAFYHRLATTLGKQHRILLVLVINQPDGLNAENASNRDLWQRLIDDTRDGQTQHNLQLRHIPTTDSSLLLVDRFSPEQQIPEKQGVGLARKIGADIALSLIHSKHIVRPWIYTSDADAHLPNDYFSALDNEGSSNYKAPCAAAIYPFKHLCDDTPVGQATRLYERRMHQYVDGLHSAGSPYAFQTIGSAIAVAAKHYAQVRGFPKRSGGEDFYLLNKLAKTGAIKKLQEPEVIIEARQSDRVPFGTGPGVSKLLLEENIQQAKIFYHPQIFIALKTWLEAMAMSRTHALNELPLPNSTLKVLHAIGASKAITAARNTSTSAPSYNKHLHTWFDAFKTLKFVHSLRDSNYPNVSWCDISKD